MIPEGSGKRLQITQILGEHLAVTQVGGTDAIAALGLDFSDNGLAQKIAVNRPLLANLMTGAASFDPAGSLSGASVSFSDYASSIISLSATAAASTKTNLATQEALQTSLVQKQSEQDGVNLDEEMSQLLVYQQSYAASAKVISTTSQLLQILNDIIP